MSHDLFEPWTIPAEAIYAAGADPATACPGRIPGDLPRRWHICSWEGSWFLLTVYVTAHTIAEVENDTIGCGREHVRLPGRAGACTYIHCDYGPNAIGDLSFPVADGLVIIRIATRSDTAAPEDPRRTASRIATILNRYLPQ